MGLDEFGSIVRPFASIDHGNGSYNGCSQPIYVDQRCIWCYMHVFCFQCILPPQNGIEIETHPNQPNAGLFKKWKFKWIWCYFLCISCWLKTKHQTPNVSWHSLIVSQFDKRQSVLFLSSIVTITKNVRWQLVICAWFPVTGWCNEKNIYVDFQMLKSSSRTQNIAYSGPAIRFPLYFHNAFMSKLLPNGV